MLQTFKPAFRRSFMKKYIYIVALLFACCLPALSQIQNPDSIRLDSLKRVLPSLSGIDRINCLNALSYEYQFYHFPDSRDYKLMADSIKHYAILANNEAKKIDYKYGAVQSLIYISTAEKYIGNLTDYEKYLLQAAALAENIQNDKLLGYVYMFRGEIEGKKNDSLYFAFTKKALQYFEKAGDIEGQSLAASWLCTVYSGKGEYEDGLEYCQKSFAATQKRKVTNIAWSNWLAQFSVTNMANLYKTAGDYETALDYYRQGFS